MSTSEQPKSFSIEQGYALTRKMEKLITSTLKQFDIKDPRNITGYLTFLGGSMVLLSMLDAETKALLEASRSDKSK